MKKIIIKVTVRVLIFAVVSALLAAINSSAILTNEIALGQLENNNTSYIALNFIQNMRLVVTILYIIFAVVLFWPVVVDIYKIIKNKTPKEEVEK